jgi:23S rRNA (cytidine1920-2'-O)/16S rRNA (cytidine1409-2'-O)-methyltransferase
MPNIKKERIDKVLVSRGVTDSRTKAQSLLMAGKVTVSGEKVEKAGTLVLPDAAIEVQGKEKEWVSRGALKLLKALDVFPLSPSGKICVDIGASTGGFTQVLLAFGADRIYSVDVGYGQLAWPLRNDSRVVVMERTNARNLRREDFQHTPDIVVADASFISLKLLLPPMDAFLSLSAEGIVLVKPQFEVGKGKVGKGGVVRSKEDHISVLEGIIDFCRQQTSFIPAGLTFSPVTGPMGNIEYLLHIVKGYDRDVPFFPASVVEKAHLFFAEGKGES